MRVGIVTSSYPTSPSDTVNAGVFVRDLALELAAMGHEVHVLTPRKRAPVIPEQLLRLCIVSWPGGEADLASASMRNPLTAMRYGVLAVSGLWHVPRYAYEKGLHAMIAMWAIPSGLFAWAAWRRWGIPYGVWVLGSDIWGRRKYPFGDSIVRRVLRDAAFRFADGIQLARDAAALAGRDCEFVPSVRRLPALQASAIALQPDGPHFLYVGRYERNKGPDTLVEAMRLLLNSGVRAYLHMFGVGSLERWLHQRIRGYEEHIALGGYADPQTVVTYMKACDWLVIPSRIESIPLIFVDALQMRLPIITTAVGDLGDLVGDHGLGRVVPATDPEALAQAMLWATAHVRGEFAGGLQEVAKRFDLMRSAARCAEALAAVAESG